ncbi:type IV pilin N-terminal domain-containing protein [Natronorubrum sulfidifaciens]|uniref:Uncharacterized protein n=1 Tax=Natronorubrum sulfidifaciens JCM 14089 TaxID=1230460 RepID=L9WD17_9EURY|nr:type IV pilin N-terminal domain-containing protein [Natronorubrum sulfidifaciens]ELY47247.1 hypothetical protein C495_03277 [Natronorubrum sulfidifaciens JCM 14089]
MTKFSRRGLLAGAGTVVTGVVAGCLDDAAVGTGESEPGNGDDTDETDSSPLAGAVTADAVVDYPEFVDGVTVSDDGRQIELADPKLEFSLSAVVEGTETGGDGLRVSRDLGSEVPTAYIAPEIGDDGVTYHVFANEAFVDHADWEVVTIEDNAITDERAASFTELQAGVSHLARESTADIDSLVVVDGGRDALERSDSEETAVGIRQLDGDTVPATPQVAFDIDHGTDSDPVVEITHASGDTLEGDHVAVDVDGERIEDPFDVETVAAGETATLEDVPAGAALRVLYEANGETAVLTSTTVRR